MKKSYEKNELTFALVWIVIYCVLQSQSTFCWVTIFYRGGSLLSCIFDHAAINMLGFMLLSGWRLGFCRYMICFVAVNLFLLLMMSWNWIR